MDERKIFIGLVVLGICCILAVLIPIFWADQKLIAMMRYARFRKNLISIKNNDIIL